MFAPCCPNDGIPEEASDGPGASFTRRITGPVASPCDGTTRSSYSTIAIVLFVRLVMLRFYPIYAFEVMNIDRVNTASGIGAHTMKTS